MNQPITRKMGPTDPLNDDGSAGWVDWRRDGCMPVSQSVWQGPINKSQDDFDKLNESRFHNHYYYLY